MIYLYEGSDSGKLYPNLWKTEVQRTIPYTVDSFWEKKGLNFTKYKINNRKKCFFPFF